MRCEIDTDLRLFAETALPWLNQDPVVNNVLHTVIEGRLAGRQPTEPGALWARVLDDATNLRGVAVRTPPRDLLLSELSSDAAQSLATALAKDPAQTALPGVNGPTAGVRAFVQAWTALTGVSAEPFAVHRVYRLNHVYPPPHAAGGLRAGRETDAGLVAQWLREFSRETGVQTSPSAGRRAELAGQLIGANELVVLGVGQPVAMAALRRPVVGVRRVSAVYTPLLLRRRGYASALVAAVSQYALDHGATTCMLYADLANPTSNEIYQRIGYQHVTDTEIWRFGETADVR